MKAHNPNAKQVYEYTAVHLDSLTPNPKPSSRKLNPFTLDTVLARRLAGPAEQAA